MPRTRPPANKHTALLVALSLLAALLACVVALALVVPRIVASKLQEAADKRALVVTFGGMGLPIGVLTLRDVAVRPKKGDAVKIAARRVDAALAGLTPSSVRVPSAAFTLRGSVDEVLAAIGPVRDAEAKASAGERLPFDIDAGTLAWSGVAGDGSSLRFDALKLSERPDTGVLELSLAKGKLALDELTLAPLEAKVKRVAPSRGSASLDVTTKLVADDGSATLGVHQDHDGDAFTLSCDGLPLASVGAGRVGGVDLRKAIVDGKASGARDADGAVRSEGKLVVSDAKLPPIEADSFTLQIGGEVAVKWRGVPKKGAPGVLRLEEGSTVEIKLAGRTLVVAIGGEISIGHDGKGPYAVHLTWASPKIPCASVVASVGGGAVSSVVRGEVSASGTIEGDPSRPAKLQVGKTLDVGCSVDVLDALPKLPIGLFPLPSLP